MNAEQYVHRLLTIEGQQERLARLEEWNSGGKLDKSFFEALKAQIQKVQSSDPAKLEKLEEIDRRALQMVMDAPCQALGLWGLGLIQAYRQQRPEAIQSFKQAMDHYQVIGDYESYGTLGGNVVAMMAAEEKDLAATDAFASHLEAELIAHACPEHVLAGRLYRSWVGVKLDLHDLDGALRLLNLSWPTIQASGDPLRQAKFYGERAQIYQQMDRVVQAERDLQQAELLFRSEGTPPSLVLVAKMAYDRARLYHKMGRLGDALQTADEASVTLQAFGQDALTQARIALRQAEILLDLEQYAQVLQSLKHIKDSFEGRPRERAWTVLLSGLACLGLGLTGTAESQLNWVGLTFAEKFPNWAYISQIGLVRLYLEWGELDKERERLEQGYALARRLYQNLQDAQPLRAAEVALSLAAYALALGQIQEVRQWIEAAGRVEDEKLFPHLAAQRQFLAGQLAEREKQPALAQEHYEKSLEIAVRLRQQLHLEALQAGMMVQREKLYQALMSVCLEQGKWEEIWRYNESARAYSLTAALARETGAALNAGASEQDVQPSQVELDALYETRARRFELCSLLYSRSEGSGMEEAQLRRQIGALDIEIESRYTDLIPQDHRGLLERELSLEQAAAHLGDGELILAYAHLGERILALAIDRHGWVARQTLPVSWKVMESSLLDFVQLGFQEWLAGWQQGPEYMRREAAAFLSTAQNQLFQLYQALWAPLEERLAAYPEIVIVADQALHALPFATLYTGEKYLIDRHTISYAPSASFYAGCCQRAQARRGRLGKEITLLAYPGHQNDLLFVEEEVRLIQEVYPEAHTLVGQKATAEALRAQAPLARVLHLATHGVMHSGNPFLSYLELSPQKDDPLLARTGYLRVYDIAQFDLRQTDLVCLSACESGEVNQRGGELLGLQWGVFQAGAYALLANLWRTDDQAACQVMAEFYRQYTPASGKAAALCTAQRALRRQGEGSPGDSDWRFAHPYLWGPFACYGFGGAIV